MKVIPGDLDDPEILGCTYSYYLKYDIEYDMIWIQEIGAVRNQKLV